MIRRVRTGFKLVTIGIPAFVVGLGRTCVENREIFVDAGSYLKGQADELVLLGSGLIHGLVVQTLLRDPAPGRFSVMHGSPSNRRVGEVIDPTNAGLLETWAWKTLQNGTALVTITSPVGVSIITLVRAGDLMQFLYKVEPHAKKQAYILGDLAGKLLEGVTMSVLRRT